MRLHYGGVQGSKVESSDGGVVVASDRLDYRRSLIHFSCRVDGSRVTDCDLWEDEGNSTVPKEPKVPILTNINQRKHIS